MTVKTSIKVPNQRSKEEHRAHLKTHQSLNLALIIEKISRQIKASHQSSAPLVSPEIFLPAMCSSSP